MSKNKTRVDIGSECHGGFKLKDEKKAQDSEYLKKTVQTKVLSGSVPNWLLPVS